VTDDISLSELEKRLSERRLEAKVGQIEITDIEATQTTREKQPSTGVTLSLENVSGDTSEVYVSMPPEYDPLQYDLPTLVEFTGADANDLETLVGSRIPSHEGKAAFAVMRQVLRSEEEAHNDWDYEKRLEKAGELRDEDREWFTVGDD
jgi:hypothetical protein